MSLLLCFSGQIGSGKSSVSGAVAEALGWPRTGFGDFLRNEVARLGGDPNVRETLQDLGQKRVDEDAIKFCRDVLKAGGFKPGDDFVIDGLRHLGIFEVLVAEGAPSQARLIFLGAPEVIRMQRVEDRSDRTDFARASNHRVEGELRDTLPKRADAVVDADQPLATVVLECLAFVRDWQSKQAE